MGSWVHQEIPQGLKPRLYFVGFAARLKSCPFKRPLYTGCENALEEHGI